MPINYAADYRPPWNGYIRSLYFKPAWRNRNARALQA